MKRTLPSAVDTVQAPQDIRLRQIDPLRDSRWDQLALSHPAATIFHRSGWARTLVEVYGYEPRYYVLETPGGELLAGWPAMLVASPITGRRLVSLPFADHCPPLVRSCAELTSLTEAILGDATELRVQRIEVRGCPEGISMPPAFQPSHGYVRHVVDLTGGAEAVYRRAHPHARRSVRRAEREGVSVRLLSDREDVSLFYDLNLRLRRRHGMLPQSREFFDAVYRNLICTGMGYVLLAEVGRTPLAAVLCLRHGDTTLDKYAVSDDRYRRFRGPHYVMWKSIATEAEQGAARYDMGRSDSKATGLQWFKEQWAGPPLVSTYYHYPAPGGMYTGDPSGWRKHALGLFSRLAPTPLYTGAGKVVYPHLG